MDKFFTDNSKCTYKTERFCTAVDHNIVLSVETGHDGSEHKICQNITSCQKKQKCRYLIPNINLV